MPISAVFSERFDVEHPHLVLVDPVLVDPEHADRGELPPYEKVYRDYVRYVASIGMKILGNESEVDDLVQDVFLSVHRGLSQVRDPRALKGWLARITVRTAQKRLRYRRVRGWLMGGVDHTSAQLVDEHASPETGVLLRAVYHVLDGVPAADRSAWVLRYIENETLPQVAELCGCSLATAKRRITRTHQKMVRELSQ